MENKMTMKEKRNSFFTVPEERETESLHTFGILPYFHDTI